MLVSNVLKLKGPVECHIKLKLQNGLRESQTSVERSNSRKSYSLAIYMSCIEELVREETNIADNVLGYLINT